MGVIGSWMVDGAEFCPRQLALIAVQKIEVLALQGVTKRFYSALKASGHFAHSCYQMMERGPRSLVIIYWANTTSVRQRLNVIL